MRLVVQEVLKASVSISGEEVASIGRGELVLVGLKEGDDGKIVERMIDKLLKARIFPDGQGMTNLSLSQIGGEILAVSQFTLYGSLKDGNRPSFVEAMKPDKARVLFKYFQERLTSLFPSARFGVFQADMQVSLVNDGPFTVLFDSEQLGYEK